MHSCVPCFYYFFLLLCLVASSCTNNKKNPFQKIDNAYSGIDFNNNISETADLNILNFHYIYNGGGVGIGDFNNDGLEDLVFTGNQVHSKIYLNEGKLKFKDITIPSGFDPDGWSTGVSIVDINADGWMDIYISTGGLDCTGQCHNYFYLNEGLDNDGVPQFKDIASTSGLQDGLYTQQAAFFDFDADGDLDVYLLHNAIDKRDKNAPRKKTLLSPASGDKLFQNNGDLKFTDVSESMGITDLGYGLGISITDFNEDNLPDIYITNDFLSNDLLYLNQGLKQNTHLGFKESSNLLLKHTSYNAMGVNTVDINNDQKQDILVLDMMPETNIRQKSMLGFMNYDKFQYSLKQGYHPQFIRNTLQINNGIFQDSLLPFSEVGHYAGIYQTDWSWTPLVVDFDHDGLKDIFITNGYGKDITDLDFINYSNQRSPFGTKEAKQKELYQTIEEMEPVLMENYFFKNEGDLNFTNVSKQWSDSQKTISNGAAFSDLDNDGDLDIIINNINLEATILENNTPKPENAKFLKIQLKGSSKNINGIGVKVDLYDGLNPIQTVINNPTNGYISSSSALLHLATMIDCEDCYLHVTWPSGNVLKHTIENWNQTIVIEDANPDEIKRSEDKQFATTLLQSNTHDLEPHKENAFSDFDKQHLLMNQLSMQGPCMAKANIDDIPGDEIFIGGAKGFAGKIYYPESSNTPPTLLPNIDQEDVDAVFFDIDNDGDQDLYVVTGGTEHGVKEGLYQDRIYYNQGNGIFEESKQLSPANSSSAVVVASDYDQDGDIDLFVGGRVVPGSFPATPRSFLLENKAGVLTDKTTSLAPALERLGLVSDAIWSDVNGDKKTDLIVIGHWMAVNIFINEGNKFKAPIPISNSNGLWNSIAGADIDKDGDQDFILGNLGLNAKLKASSKSPLFLYKNDFDGNGSIDPIIGHFADITSKEFVPLHTRDDIMKQVVSVKNRLKTYKEFGLASLNTILEVKNEAEAYLQVQELASIQLINNGNGTFKIQPLPSSAQLAPIQDISILDINADGNLDAILVGNDYTCESNNGWYDAFNGLVLLGNENGNLIPQSIQESGLFIPGDARQILLTKNKKQDQQIWISQNQNEFKSYQVKNSIEQ